MTITMTTKYLKNVEIHAIVGGDIGHCFFFSHSSLPFLVEERGALALGGVE